MTGLDHGAPPVVFVIPESDGVASGGHLYNQRLIAALSAEGCDVRVSSFDGFVESTGNREPGHYFVDTLFLQRCVGLSIADLDVHLLVHHLPAMSPPVPGGSAESLVAEQRVALQLFGGFLVTSEYTRDYLVEQGIGPESVVVVMPGVEVPVPRTVPEEGKLVVLIVANLIQRKQVLLLLESLVQVVGLAHTLRLRIVGGEDLEPDYASACQNLVREEPILTGRVEFVGTLSHDDTMAEYARADLFVSAASMETFGMALQEAVAAGLPVFAVKGGFVASHVRDGVNGRVFADCRTLAHAMRELSEDREELRSLQRSAPLVTPLGERSWAAAARRFVAAYS